MIVGILVLGEQVNAIMLVSGTLTIWVWPLYLKMLWQQLLLKFFNLLCDSNINLTH